MVTIVMVNMVEAGEHLLSSPQPQAFALLSSGGNRKWYGVAGGPREEASNAPLEPTRGPSVQKRHALG